MRRMISELVQYRHLLYMLTWRDIKIRYKQSVMGFLWAVLMPVLIIVAGVLVKKAFSIASGAALNMTEIASISVKSLPWAFFVGAVKFATNSLLNNQNLVTKIYFPRETFPLAAILASLFDLAVASAAIVVLLVWAKIGISIYLLWVPVLVILLVLLTAALGMLMSCGNLFFRDVKYLVEVLLTFGIFFTPVFYDANAVGKWATLLLLNPLSPILESINSVVVLHKPPDTFWLTYSIAWTAIGFPAAWIIFDKAEATFAENI